PNAAGERVRVARALRDLPATFEAFAAGRLSFTQVRAISRVATVADEANFIEMARHATGGQLERLVGGLRRAQKLLKRRNQAAAAEAEGRKPEPEGIRVFTRYDDDGDLHLTIRANATDGVVLLAAIEAARHDLDTTNLSAERSDRPDRPAAATRGDGLLAVCRAYLNERAAAHPDRARRDRSQLTVHIDPISGWARLPDGEFLPPGSLAVRPLRPDDLTAHDSGRDLRHPSQPLRDLLGAVDGERCRYPACTRRRKLHAHHVIEWNDGGPTDLANLVLACSRHHTLIHADGIRLKLNPSTRALTVTTAAGSAVPHRTQWPWKPAEHLDPDHTINAATLPPRAGDTLDLHYAVEVLMQHAA
ncbi:MAG TPA: HNH endonuclease, partial [Frankiaceae bacterium]|nr:HNH endonuclease [Frankiaceae bacterium]